jgi:hypothetical protein
MEPLPKTQIQKHTEAVKEFASLIKASWVSWEPHQVDIMLDGCSYTFDLSAIQPQYFMRYILEKVFSTGVEEGKNNIRRAFKDLMETE